MSTIVYRYGLLRPTLGRSEVTAQIDAAHRYYNELTAIERNRRASIRLITAELVPEVALLDERIEHLTTEADAKPAKARLKEIGAELRSLRKQRKEAYAPHSGDGSSLRLAWGEVEARAKELAKAARSVCGLYWGTYLEVEAAAHLARSSVTPPRFRRRKDHHTMPDGSTRLPVGHWGAVAVQIQGGITSEEALACADTRLQLAIDPTPRGRHNHPTKPPRRRGVLRMRVGSVGRDPVWAEWPIIYDRPLPVGAQIMGARVRLEVTPRGEEWVCTITLRVQDAPRVLDPQRVVAIESAWDDHDSGGLVVARWLGSDGRSGEVIVSVDIVGGLDYADQVRSTRDKHIDAMRDGLSMEWSRLPAEDRRRWPIAQMRSPHSWLRMLDAMRVGPEPVHRRIAEYLVLWARRNSHLWRMEHGQRSRIVRRRCDVFWAAANALAADYSIAVMSARDLREAAKSGRGDAENWKRTTAAPSELMARVKQRLHVVTVDAIGLEAVLARGQEMLAEPGALDPKPPRPARFSKRHKPKHETSTADTAGPLADGPAGGPNDGG